MKIIFSLYFSSFILIFLNIHTSQATNLVNPTTIYFNPYKNGVQQSKIYFDYEVGPDYIKIGQTRLSKDSFMVFLGPPKNLHKNISNLMGFSSETILLVTFPKNLMSPDSIEMFNENGQVLWQHRFEKSEKELGTIIQKALRTELFNLSEKLDVNVIQVDPEEMGFNSASQNRFIKFCLRQNHLNAVTQSCSQPFKYQKKSNLLKPTGLINNIKININGSEVKNSDSLLIDPSKKVIFYANSANQISFDFSLKPLPLLLRHFFRDGDKQKITLIGKKHIPNDNNIKINYPYRESGFLFDIDWLPTIGELDKHWALNIDQTSAKLFMTGEQGGEFTYLLEIPNAPTKELQIKISNDRPKGSYASEIRFKGSTANNTTVSSKQNKANMNKNESDKFTWNFQNKEKGILNTSTLLLTSGTQIWVAEHSMFRAFSNEISFRLASIITSKMQLNLLAELTLNHWFEDLLDWQNELLSVQRWGLSLKTFFPLKTFNFKDKNAEIISLKLTTFDLKYRFTPGLWERDETWGLLLC